MSINLLDERRFFHRQLTQTRTLSINAEGVATTPTVSAFVLRGRTVHRPSPRCCGRRTQLDGQSAGKNFEAAVAAFVSATFPALSVLRPGQWEILNVGSTRQGNSLPSLSPIAT